MSQQGCCVQVQDRGQGQQRQGRGEQEAQGEGSGREGTKHTEHGTQERCAETEAQLSIDVPQGAGMAHVRGASVEKGQGLCRAAAQAAAQTHQGIGKDRQHPPGAFDQG
ncbi:hypothetical protein D3C80_1427220 [compost metagenome]